MQLAPNVLLRINISIQPTDIPPHPDAIRIRHEPTIHLRATRGDDIRLSCIDAPLNAAQHIFNWYRTSDQQLLSTASDTASDDHQNDRHRRWHIDHATGALHIDNVVPADSDLYKCVVPSAIDAIVVGATQLTIDGDDDGQLMSNDVHDVVDDTRNNNVNTAPAQLLAMPSLTDLQPVDIRVGPSPQAEEHSLLLRVSWTAAEFPTTIPSSYYYHISVRSANTTYSDWHDQRIANPNTSHIDVTVPQYALYSAHVRLTNDHDDGFDATNMPELHHNEASGFPSQCRPTVQPPPLRQCRPDELPTTMSHRAASDQRSVCFEWSPAEAAGDAELGGHLVGYRLYTWHVYSRKPRTEKRYRSPKRLHEVRTFESRSTTTSPHSAGERPQTVRHIVTTDVAKHLQRDRTVKFYAKLALLNGSPWEGPTGRTIRFWPR